MDTIIFLVVGVVAIGVLLEAKKRRDRKCQSNNSTPEEAQRTAAEVGPTETGKFRVDLMLKKTEHLQSKNKDQNNDNDVLDEETPLPDPFKK